MYWEPQLLKFPCSETEDAEGTCHAKLTEAGLKKLRSPVPVFCSNVVSPLFVLEREDVDSRFRVYVYMYNI